MKVVITGGGGFIGQRLAQALLSGPGISLHKAPGDSVAPVAVKKVVCVDQVAGSLNDDRIEYKVGDVSSPELINESIDADTGLVFHLAAVVSGTAEADFDLGLRVNVAATRMVLQRCRELGTCPRLVFSSSIAAFGGDLPDVITDGTMPMPQGSYGVQKVIGELMVQDYSRKGFIEGCSLRLPTVIVRPGKPNGAASSFASAIIREPLSGVPLELPVEPETRMWSTSPATVVTNMIHAAELAPSAWGTWRAINLPGIVVSMSEALDALQTVGGSQVRDLVTVQPDEDVLKLVRTWPEAFETPRATQMGFSVDRDLLSIVRAYINDYPEAIKVPLVS
jgi:nucleoside-diphosphate-sugar epimerase